jgi:energy-coupling factor transport system ATP-binding protein
MIKIEKLYAGVLNIETLSIAPGISVITGPNGSGKTTLLKVLAGIIKPVNGSVIIDNRCISDCRVGWIGEYPDRNTIFTRVYDEIAGPLRFIREDCEIINSRVLKIVDDLKINSLLNRDIRTLSAGQKVIVAYAAVMISKPELVLLDETDSHIDDEFCKFLDEILDRADIRYRIFSTHRYERMAIADEIIRLNEGKITDHSPVSSLLPVDDSLSDILFWQRVIADTKWN